MGRCRSMVVAGLCALGAASFACSSNDGAEGNATPGVSPPTMATHTGAASAGMNPGSPNSSNPAMHAPASGAAGAAASTPMTTPMGPAGAPMSAQPPGAAGAMAPPDPMTGMVDRPPPTPHEGSTCLMAGNGQYTSPGPYKVAKKDVDLGMIEASQHTGKFTIYYPDPLEANCKHPIVAWGNGTGVTDSDFTYDFLNSNAASWGMVVAASSEDNTGSGAFHKAGLDYLLAQNADPSSMFYQKLSTRAGVSGHSQGGFGANVGASHPNVEAAVVEGATFVSTDKVVGLTMTGTNDLGVGAADGVTGARGPMFVGVWEGGNHVGTETVLGFLGLDTTSGDAMVSQKGSIQFQRLYAAWFRCFLADDQTACALFSGGTPDSCGICKDPGWAKLASAKM